MCTRFKITGESEEQNKQKEFVANLLTEFQILWNVVACSRSSANNKMCALNSCNLLSACTLIWNMYEIQSNGRWETCRNVCELMCTYRQLNIIFYKWFVYSGHFGKDTHTQHTICILLLIGLERMSEWQIIESCVVKFEIIHGCKTNNFVIRNSFFFFEGTEP